ITFAIIISLFISVSAIPTMTNQFYRLSKGKKVRLKALTDVGNFFVKIILYLSNLTLKNGFTRVVTVVGMTVISILIAYVLMPKAEYLPQGNRNLIINIMLPPPGYSVSKRQAMGHAIFKATRPYFETDYKDEIPRIKTIFYVGADRITLFGAISAHETEAKKMMPLFSKIMNSIPGVFGVSTQVGIFQSGIGRGRNIDVNIAGENVDQIIQAARILFGTIR
ncbi:MAG: AcrB/AcrD/AcrF family protein, partial [Deltaproteobacteria bacterium]|nr:AcrB/AcrD/AcrF family protein [Deltaproteobacteria bacterium]